MTDNEIATLDIWELARKHHARVTTTCEFDFDELKNYTIEVWQAATAVERERCAIYATAEPTRWISVDEQLPPARVTVFMCRSHGERDMAFYDAGRYDPPWRYASDSSESIRDVIFWMHLPLPPTGTVGM